MRNSLNPVLLSLSFLLLVGSLVYVLILFKDLSPFGRQALKSVNEPPQAIESSLSYLGTIVRDEALVQGLATSHRLVDEKGQTLAHLESHEIDLRLLEGLNVTLDGVREKYLSDNLPLILVRKVTFR